jgi:hypothetical protein
MPLLGPAAAGALGGGELEEAALAGGFDATEPGDAAVEGGGLAAFAETAAPEETAAPWGAGLAPPAGEGLSSSFGARAPMFARSCPMRILPRKTGRSKM